ncbi:MAG: hypothetical protein RI907_2449, partial [Pseudomonadota bacterium]
EGTQALLLRDPLRNVYKKLVLKGDTLVGACLYGDVADGPWYFDLIKQKASVADQRDTLMFGPLPAQQAA